MKKLKEILKQKLSHHELFELIIIGAIVIISSICVTIIVNKNKYKSTQSLIPYKVIKTNTFFPQAYPQVILVDPKYNNKKDMEQLTKNIIKNTTVLQCRIYITSLSMETWEGDIPSRVANHDYHTFTDEQEARELLNKTQPGYIGHIENNKLHHYPKGMFDNDWLRKDWWLERHNISYDY